MSGADHGVDSLPRGKYFRREVQLRYTALLRLSNRGEHVEVVDSEAATPDFFLKLRFNPRRIDVVTDKRGWYGTKLTEQDVWATYDELANGETVRYVLEV
jgi:hypothetical protein